MSSPGQAAASVKQPRGNRNRVDRDMARCCGIGALHPRLSSFVIPAETDDDHKTFL